MTHNFRMDPFPPCEGESREGGEGALGWGDRREAVTGPPTSILPREGGGDCPEKQAPETAP